MLGEAARIALYGSGEPLAPQQAVEVGHLTCQVDHGAIRSISWKGVEVVRAINRPVRDESWITLPQSTRSAADNAQADEAQYLVESSVADGALECLLSAVFSSACVASLRQSWRAAMEGIAQPDHANGQPELARALEAYSA